MEADLTRFYGVSLADYTTGELTARRLRTLIGELPPASATSRSVNGAAGDWSREAVYLTDVFHALTSKPHPDRDALARQANAELESEAVAALRRRVERERQAR